MNAVNELRTRRWGARVMVVAASVALHGALIVWLMGSRLGHPLPTPTEAIAVELVAAPVVEPEPEPVVEPEPELEPEPEPEPIVEPVPEPEVTPEPPKVAPRPAPAPAPSRPSGPPVHSFGANDEWAAPPAVPQASEAVRSRPVPAGYADTVKNRVTANLRRPEGSVYKPPPGYKGDPNDFKRQCYIPYEITVDGAGRMVSYEIDRCGDELLDAAAEQAVRNAGPFPPPPNQGAEKYVIYGTAIFIN